MPRSLFQPRWLALHVIALALVIAFVVLGWWQLGVYRDSEERHDVRAAAPAPISAVAEPGRQLGAARDRHVTADGVYTHDLVVPARVHDGVLGAYALATLETADGILIVLRGWQADPAEIEPVSGAAVSVRGHLIPAETPAHATGGIQADDSTVRYLAPGAVNPVIGADESRVYAGYLVLADESPPPAAPPEHLDVDVVSPVRDVSPWQNLSYWAQWWVFAGAVVVFWISMVRGAVKQHRSRQTPDAQSEPRPRPSARR